MFTVENFIRGLKNALIGLQIEVQDDKIMLLRPSRNSRFTEDQSPIPIQTVGEIELEEIQRIIEEIQPSGAFNDYMLYKKTEVEIPVDLHDRMRMSPRFYDRECFQTSEHNYRFVISKASVYYVVALMCSISDNFDVDMDLFPLYRIARRDEIIESAEELSDLFRLLTVKIVAPIECSLSEYKRMLNSYLFNISYNSNNVFSILNLSEKRQPLRHRVYRDGQLFPYKQYNQELVKYYYQGVSTDIPFTQYLAFYHVAEFFFQTIAEQSAFQEIENFITRPSFSPYKKEDVRLFYNRIKKKMRDQRDDGVWDEKIGLLLCLKKYVPDIENLKNEILSIESSAIDYYKTTDVPFADEGKTINFDDTTESIYTTIRNRVYSVRNAIVHSKEGEKLRYEPFKHDKALSKEIPLIRAIAEEILINSAKQMELKFTD